jgi:hypothetical protein
LNSKFITCCRSCQETHRSVDGNSFRLYGYSIAPASETDQWKNGSTIRILSMWIQSSSKSIVCVVVLEGSRVMTIHIICCVCCHAWYSIKRAPFKCHHTSDTAFLSYVFQIFFLMFFQSDALCNLIRQSSNNCMNKNFL